MSAVLARKKSPRAPSIALDEALDRALKAYDKQQLQPAPTEVVAQNLGYKSANNGAALSALASLRYYGLVERPKDGFLALTKDLEAYKFSLNSAQKQSLLIAFLKKPALFAELLVQYESGLPSDTNLRYALIQLGFSAHSAESVVTVFRKSADFADFFSAPQPTSQEGVMLGEALRVAAQEPLATNAAQPEALQATAPAAPTARIPALDSLPKPLGSVGSVGSAGDDQIPIRLQGGRRAWLVIPTPFYAADKLRLKAQIDLLLTQDEEDQA